MRLPQVAVKGPIQAVEVSYFVHPTEEAERVEAAVKNSLSIEAEPERERLEGHFGYAIVYVRYHLTGDEAKRVVDRLALDLDPQAKKSLGESIDGSIDEHSSLYLRLDKQEMMVGRLVLGRSDAVRVRIKPRLYRMSESAPTFYRGLVGLHG